MLAKPKKIPISKLKAKADALASAYYRALTPYCQAEAALGMRCGGNLQWCHLFSRAILHMRYEPYNNIIMCQGHHFRFTHNPIEWTRFLEAKFPNKLQEAEANRNKFGKPDYQEWIDFFKAGLA